MDNKELQCVFCVGAQKAGTSYLFKLLEQHPEICSSGMKEIHYYTEKIKYKKGKQGFLNLFEPDGKTKYLADFSPIYLPTESALKMVSDDFKDSSKIIVLLRDPVKRAFSHYNMKINKGLETRSFSKMVKEEVEKEKLTRSILGRGQYASQLDILFKYFDKEQTIIMSFDEYIGDTKKSLKKIMQFLEIDTNVSINYDVSKNARKKIRFAFIIKLIYCIPAPIRKGTIRFLNNNRFTKGIMKKIRKIMVIKDFEITKPDAESIKILSDYYKRSNELVKEKYHIDTDNWL